MTAWDDCKAALPEGGRLTVRERENGTVEAFAQDVTTHRALGFAYGSTPDAALTALRVLVAGTTGYVCPTCHRLIEREAGDPRPNSPGDHDPAYHVAKAYA